MAQKYLDYEGLKKVITGLQSYSYAVVGNSASAFQTALDTKQATLVSGNNIKTINGESVLGSGDITIDLSLYKVVTELPTSDIDTNKIYLIISKVEGDANKYTEYIYVNDTWEKLGEYTASIDLSPYLKSEDAAKLYVTYEYAANTYLSKADAANVYLTYDNATSYYYDKATVDEKTKNELSDAEKKWIASQLFSTLFSGTITASPSSVTFAGSNVTVTFTLQTKYDGALVDLDSVPSGWTKTSTGTYTKTGTVTATANASSGDVTAIYNGNSKSISGKTCSRVIDSYMLESASESLSTSDLDSIATNGTKMNSGTSVTGDKSFTIQTTGDYLFFAISNTSSLKDVKQLGNSILQNTSGTVVARTNYGNYKVYRTANALAAGNLSFTIS